MDNAIPTVAFEWATIWDRLVAAGVPAAYYASDLPFLALWGGRLVPSTRSITDYFTDCAAGTLPNVTFVDPAFLGAGENDDHPLADVRAGQHFLKDVFKAFTTSPHWQTGAFILTYDEWGGFFDHVTPPHFTDDRASTDDLADFGQAGFRVPTIVASPFSPKGFVDDSLYDHSSILRFLEWRFLGAPAEGPGGAAGWSLTSRDRNAFNIGASLRSTRVSNDLGFDLDTLPIGQPNPPCGSVATQLEAASTCAPPRTTTSSRCSSPVWSSGAASRSTSTRRAARISAARYVRSEIGASSASSAATIPSARSSTGPRVAGSRT